MRFISAQFTNARSKQSKSSLKGKITKSNPTRSGGFTLIELLVVLSIIAILAGISVAVFVSGRGGASDGKRRSEISSIAKSIEAAKDYAQSPPTYRYDTATAKSDFPKGIPYTDGSSKNCRYCIKTRNDSTSPPANMIIGTKSASCAMASQDPTGGPNDGGNGYGYTNFNFSVGTTAANNLGAGDVKAWTLCAILETSNSSFCISSLTK